MEAIQSLIGELQLLSDINHYQNLLKILRFNFWSDNERIYYLQMYDKLVIKKMDWDNLPRNYINRIERFFEIIEYHNRLMGIYFE